MPCSCGRKVERSETKIKCGDCNIYFHTSCVNLNDTDVDFMLKSKTIFRCDKCSVLRRKSISVSATFNGNNIPSNANITPAEKSVNPSSNEISLQDVYAEILQLKQLNCDALLLINSLQEDKKKLQSRIDSLERTVNFLQNSRKRKYIEIVGVPEVNNSNAIESVIKICSEALDINVKKEDVDLCFVKKIKSNSSSKTSTSVNNQNNYINIVCAKFKSMATKQNIMNKRIANKKKFNAGIFAKELARNKIFINDSLSPYTRSLLKAANEFKTSNHYKYLWIRNSTILMRKLEGGPVIKINSFEDLNDTVHSS